MFSSAPCPECGSPVGYHDKRRRCPACDGWVHLEHFRTDAPCRKCRTGNRCPECGLQIQESDPIRKCPSCEQPVHAGCVKEPYCHECRNLTLQQCYEGLLEAYAPDLVGKGEVPGGESLDALKVVIAGMYVGSFYSDVAAMTGLPIGTVERLGSVLRENKIWLPDGTVRIDDFDRKDHRAWGIVFILHSLVATRHLVVTYEDGEKKLEKGPALADPGVRSPDEA
jgi:hypothetical protein